ncbi:MAG: M28 family metallopeptidase, partial [Acidobacteriota bacterium]|nr:M28 family metallopeptidase [Acidobacteriota bacterium]
IKAHIDFLASDELEGRETGTRGYDIAAEYLATQLAGAGVEPAGDDGKWFQAVPLRTYRLDASRSSFCIRANDTCTSFEIRKDVTLSAGVHAASDVDAEVVFAGFGITAPELGRDDYAGLDVRGKIVAILSGAPPSFPHSQRAYYSNGTVKSANAVGRGAIGIVNIRSLETERRTPWPRALAQADTLSMRALDRAGQPMETFPQIRGSATLGRDAAAMLFSGEAMTFEAIQADAEKGIARSFPLHKRVTMHTTATIGEASSVNVAGIIRGSDPALAGEQVILSAHLDHLGIAAEGTDRIRNGALDNASGIAALIEIARDIVASNRRPRRSIIILAVTGEEKGLQGSLAYATRPGVREQVVANVNMDMLTMLFPLASLAALGEEHSSLGSLARRAAEQNGFVLEPDPLPEEVRFTRSDQYSFVKQGIPAISYKGGLQSKDPAIDGAKITRDWLHDVYHTPADERTQHIDYDSGVRWAKTNEALVVMIANLKRKPRWNQGDFFGERFGR